MDQNHKAAHDRKGERVSALHCTALKASLDGSGVSGLEKCSYEHRCNHLLPPRVTENYHNIFAHGNLVCKPHVLSSRLSSHQGQLARFRFHAYRILLSLHLDS